jgi:hypothetical protein
MGSFEVSVEDSKRKDVVIELTFMSKTGEEDKNGGKLLLQLKFNPKQ